MDVDGTEVSVGGTGPGGYAYTGPRGRVGRENLERGIKPPPATMPRPRRERPQRPPEKPTYQSAAAAAAAVAQGDGYKPREERGWEEFHQDLDIEARFPVFSAAEVDGRVPTTPGTVNGSGGLNGEGSVNDEADQDSILTTPRRRPGRPPRRPEAMLTGLGTPEVPKSIPLPGPNPRERLTLPKPSFRLSNPFAKFEDNKTDQRNYVDRSMANVGYQENDYFARPERRLIRILETAAEEDLDLGTSNTVDGESNAAIGSAGVGRVEYDMDEQDEQWLETINIQRKDEGVDAIKPAIFEITMTKIEKEWHALEKRIPKPNPKPPQTHRPRSSSAAAVNGEPAGQGEEQDSKCAICDDGDCENTNAIVFCDGCDLAVHQECYGVPFIPEGQWLCRRCQLIGRGTPTCIFCPNIEGAFKQTNTSRWSHLLCAIWIPEVSLGNTTFMEPVMEVEKVPKGRWKLNCYICHQKMGACIQCGNKNCYQAFHVTCARRSRLFLKMKTPNAGPATIEPSQMKAFCDKHSPAEWKREHNTDQAATDAQDFYRHAFYRRKWADSQSSALAMAPAQAPPPGEPMEDEGNGKTTLTMGNKRKGLKKAMWKLPSGAPVIPQVVYNSVELSLQRFNIRKRKEYAAEACKYWTLKREARRGAALLKRLQLQMETFTSMEITRRNFAGMGAAGGIRLQRRIQFAENLVHDMERLRLLCDAIRSRELEKLKDAEILKEVVDTVYFPIPPLLWPILEKAQTYVCPHPSLKQMLMYCSLDGKNVFLRGLIAIRSKLENRLYTSVPPFSADLAAVFSSEIGVEGVENTADLQQQIAGRAVDIPAEQREKRKLAKRIIKAVQRPLEDAIRKEGELSGKPFEKELKELDLLLETSVLSRRDSFDGSAEDGSAVFLVEQGKTGPSGNTPQKMEIDGEQDDEMLSSEQINGDAARSRYHESDSHYDASLDVKAEALHHTNGVKHERPFQQNSPPSANGESALETSTHLTHQSHPSQDLQPPTPPMSFDSDQAPAPHGGIPWYMQPFDPQGTTIHDERWTGREVLRGMSEELSELDDDALEDLADDELAKAAEKTGEEAAKAKKKAAAAKRRRNRYRY